ncbi:MAG TPA: hypothetical protein VJ624_05160 [Thermodesulfobacteriota bacterium]|nr:hypothetical protein [Thermodesulfobacteriota bacterium]
MDETLNKEDIIINLTIGTQLRLGRRAGGAGIIPGKSAGIQRQFMKDRDLSLQSYTLADELRQSSDDLTRFARIYVATGDPKYEQFIGTFSPAAADCVRREAERV